MTSKIIIVLSVFLLVLNLYAIKEGYEYTHLAEINKRDGQYGMVYGFYGIIQMFNFLVCIPLLMVLLRKKKTQKPDLFKTALALLIFNPTLISLGWWLLD